MYNKEKACVLLGCYCFWEWFLRNYFLNFVCVYLSLKKLINRKHFPVKEKFDLVSGKCFSEKFERKILSRNYEKFRNVILFADYIKFTPQTFDCHIYFVLNIYFSISYLKFNFYINFDPYFYNCYLLFPCHFFIEIFYLSNLILILFIITYFIWNNLWNIN
jgi:hypothetical protein